MKRLIVVGFALVLVVMGASMFMYSSRDGFGQPHLADHIQGLGALTVELTKAKLRAMEARIQMEDMLKSLDVPPEIAGLADHSALSQEDQQRYKPYFDAMKSYEIAKLVEQAISKRLGQEVRSYPATQHE